MRAFAFLSSAIRPAVDPPRSARRGPVAGLTPVCLRFRVVDPFAGFGFVLRPLGRCYPGPQ